MNLATKVNDAPTAVTHIFFCIISLPYLINVMNIQGLPSTPLSINNPDEEDEGDFQGKKRKRAIFF